MERFDEQLRADRAMVEDHLSRCFENRPSMGELYDAMRYSLLAGGKRIRPILTLECCRLCGGDPVRALPLACAVEMVHTYSLIHDDLPCMDNDDLRRGRPTNHRVYGEATAILAGDALLTAAFEMISECGLPPERSLAAVASLGRAAGARGMVGGQALDIAGEGHVLSAQDVERLQRLKTGALISAAAEMGCIAAGGGGKAREAVRGYAAALGLAFQIRDDILDVEGDEATLGKTVGSDAVNEKTTFVSLKGPEACEALVQEQTTAAKAALRNAFADAGFLCWLADKLVEREK